MLRWATLVLLGGCVGSPADPPSAPNDKRPDAPTPSSSSTVRHPGVPVATGPAVAVGVADLDGDGSAEVVAVSASAVTGVIQGTATLGRSLVIASGMGRGARDAPAQVQLRGHEGSEVIWERSGERTQISDLRVVDGRIWMATFADKWNVEGGWLEDGVFTPVHSARMAMAMAPLPGGEVAVGRLYGEAPRSDGDLRIVAADGSERLLPGLRGVRTIATGDLDGDGHPELIVGDGWHSNYGENADARVVVYAGPDYTEHRVIAGLSGEYTAEHITVLDEGADAWLLVTGSAQVHALQRDRLGWADVVVGPVSDGGGAAAWRDKDGWVVTITGDPATDTPLRAGL
jgi:hypothetical protein